MSTGCHYYCLAAELEEDDANRETVGAVSIIKSGEGISPAAPEAVHRGRGPTFVAEFAARVLQPSASAPTVYTFGGLEILRLCWEALESSTPGSGDAVRQLAASEQHADVLFDFTCDNGYEAPWDTLVAPTLGSSPASDTVDALAAELHRLVSAGLSSGALKRTTMAGGQSSWPLAGGRSATLPGFRSVPRAASLARVFPPDQSWKSHGIIDPVSPAAWAVP
jgi:hypothetical protein